MFTPVSLDSPCNVEYVDKHLEISLLTLPMFQENIQVICIEIHQLFNEFLLQGIQLLIPAVCLNLQLVIM